MMKGTFAITAAPVILVPCTIAATVLELPILLRES